ncbi:MAG: hypothetical protein KJI71_01240 [Patescibacteria group bacterium]|nr:hypothetical protein [Patescibacteria group bacterium]
MSDLAWMGLKNDRSPLPKDQQIALVNAITEEILDTSSVDLTTIDEEEEDIDEAEDTGISTNDFDDIDKIHPYEALKLVLGTLRTIKQRADIYSDKDNADWGRISLSAVKEARHAVKDILPIWEEMENRFNEKKEEWVNQLIDFNCKYITKEFGEGQMLHYMETLNEFRKSVEEENKKIA